MKLDALSADVVQDALSSPFVEALLDELRERQNLHQTKSMEMVVAGEPSTKYAAMAGRAQEAKDIVALIKSAKGVK